MSKEKLQNKFVKMIGTVIANNCLLNLSGNLCLTYLYKVCL